MSSSEKKAIHLGKLESCLKVDICVPEGFRQQLIREKFRSDVPSCAKGGLELSPEYEEMIG